MVGEGEINMAIQPQISFRNLDTSESVKDRIAGRVAELEQFCDQIVGCKVMVETSHRHHHGRSGRGCTGAKRSFGET